MTIDYDTTDTLREWLDYIISNIYLFYNENMFMICELISFL